MKKPNNAPNPKMRADHPPVMTEEDDRILDRIWDDIGRQELEQKQNSTKPSIPSWVPESLRGRDANTFNSAEMAEFNRAARANLPPEEQVGLIDDDLLDIEEQPVRDGNLLGTDRWNGNWINILESEK